MGTAMDSGWMSSGDASRYVGMSVKTLYRLRLRGILRYCKVGNRVYFKKSDIDRMMERYRVV